MAAEDPGPAGSPKKLRGWKPPDWDAIVIIAAGLILALALNAAYTTWAVSVSQHRWCDTIGLLDRAEHGTQAPSSAYGKQLAADFSRLYPALGCSR